ncbi:MAG TPA: SIMPL domain-containing protein [Steroidobacteraceae bacterium]|nr:SIMPL domain-containing protein [Steroidobacteraceae bacterium]
MRSVSPWVPRVLSVGLLAACCAIGAGARAQTPGQLSSMRVTGDARVSARPDRVQIDIGVSTPAQESQDAAAQNARETDAVLAAVRKAAGAGAQLRTTSYSLSPRYQYRPGAEPTITGYTALNLVEVTLDDLSRIGNVIDAATHSGANRVQGIQFTLRDQDAVRAQALREAATRARAEADVLAAALGLKILRVLSVEESSPRFVPMRMNMAAARSAAADVATPVESGALDVSAQVTLMVEVGPSAR